MYHDAYQVYELLDKWNAQGPPQTALVQELFLRFPESAKQEFLFGQTLLHKCVEYYSSRLDLIQVLINAYPEAITKKDANGYLPIHRALISADTRDGGEPAFLELIQLFVDLAPETIWETTPTGALPLHLACARYYYDTTTTTTDIVVRYLVRCFPEAIAHRDNAGRFPLQHALEAQRPQPSIVQLLLEKYPVIVSFLDDEGYLPLHRILQKGRSSDNRIYDSIVELLVRYCPGTLRLQETQGLQTPLCMACQNNNSLSQIYSLVRSWPEQVYFNGTARSLTFETERFNGEMLPSALASSSGTLERLQMWVERYPHMAIMAEPDLQGRIPLHYAAISKSNDAVGMVEYMLLTEPGSLHHAKKAVGESLDSSLCQTADYHGRLPLHFAAAAGNKEIFDRLCSRYPAGLIRADIDGRLPWHYAECARLDMAYEQTLEYVMSTTHGMGDDYADEEARMGTLDLVPDEIRWDVLQVVHDEQC